MDLIDRNQAIKAVKEWEKIYTWDDWCSMHSDEKEEHNIVAPSDVISKLPSAEPVIRCKDCFYGYLYSGVYAGTTCSWVECKNPDGLNRDVSLDGYCSAAVRRKDDE